MAWPQTQNPARLYRSRYNGGPSYTFQDDPAQYGYNNRFGPRPRGRPGVAPGRFAARGGARGGRWSSYDRNGRFPSDVSDKFDEFDLEGEAADQNGGGGINFDAYESVPVEVSGEGVPAPVNTFAETDLDEALKENIERCKYVKPTPIQRHAIPVASAGRDLMACAQTGSGKTAAFCFPIISGILKSRCAGLSSVARGVAYPTALILSPTRELSCQIHDEAKKFAYQTGVKVVVAYGGAPASLQLRNLEKGVDILVATPGRLVDFIERERVSLTNVKYLALDEADRMLDMGFEHQIRKIVQQMHMPSPGVRQTMLFSATFPNDIQRLASDFLSNYIFLAVGRVGSSTELIVQKVEHVQDIDKRNQLKDLLHGQRARGVNGKKALTLVFVETKKGADNLEYWLSRNGFPAIAIHGDKVQMERERALRSFKSGVTPILVATDVASRGLDIPHVSHVINFDLPRDIDDYVHRIGRTGRAGKSGLATAFFSSKNVPIAKALVELLQEAKQEVPLWLTQYSESSSFSGGSCGSYRPQRYSSGNYGGRDYRNNATEPEARNYSHSSTYGNGDHAGDSYANNNNSSYARANSNGHSYADDNSFAMTNSNGHTNSAYDIANSVPAASYHYADANSDMSGGGGKGDNGPQGYASIVATGWD